MAQRLARLLVGMFFCAAASICQAGSAKDIATWNTALHPQPLRDYFFYICVHEYIKGTDLGENDISQIYILDALSSDAETLDLVDSKAKATADALKASHPREDQVSEGTYGKVSILAVCLEESRVFKIPRARAGK